MRLLRAPSRRSVFLFGSLLGLVGVGLFVGYWFNSQVTLKSASIYGVVIPSKYSRTNQAIYISAATPKTAYNGDMNTSGTSPDLSVAPNGNNSFIVRLKSNITTGDPQSFYISDIPVAQGVTVRNYSFFVPFTTYWSSSGPPYTELPYNLEVRLLAASPVGTISWQSYITYNGYNNYGLDDIRSNTSEINLILFATAAVLVWGMVVRGITRRRLPFWFPLGTVVLFGVTLFTYVFIGGGSEILTPGWEPPWTWLLLLFAHQGFTHLTNNLPALLAGSASLEVTLRKFGDRRLYLLGFGLPVVFSYFASLILSSFGVSVLLGVFAVTLWSVLALYRGELVGKVGIKWVLVTVAGSGLALYGVTLAYLGELALSSFQLTNFGIQEAVGHPAFIAILGVATWLILKISKEGITLGRRSKRLVTLLRKPGVAWGLPIFLLEAEFLYFSFFPLRPYNGPPLPVAVSITCANASRWVITSCNPTGQLTSFLVFDGWTNMFVLLYSCLLAISLFIRSRGPGWRISIGLLLMTNLAGLISPSVIYLFPPNGFASWGMSSATFAALGFGMAGCAYASLKGLDELKSYAAPYRWYFLALLGLTLFGAALFSLALNKSLEVDAVHATSFLIGLATGSLAIARTAPSAPRVAPPYQDR